MGINIDFFVSDDRIQKIFDLKITKIKMSLELFHEVPTRAIETLFDKQNQPLLKRADSGKYLGIRNIGDNFKEFPFHHAHPRSEIERHGLTIKLGRTNSPHDIFINLDGSIEMAIRYKKPKAVSSVKWLSKKGVEKIQEEHQQAIEEKDATIAQRDNQIQTHQQKILRLNEEHQQAVEEKDAKIALLNDDLKNREQDNVALQAQRDVFKQQDY